MTVDQVKKLVEEKGIEFFLCSFVEMGGAPKAKVVPVTNLEDMAAEGAGFAGFAAGNMGQGPHDNDMANIPDFSSLTIVPWRPNMAWVAGDVQVDGVPFNYCPRTILKRQLAKAEDKGYSLHTGVEPEFMLLKRGEDGQYSPYDELDVLDKPCYDLITLNRNFDIMTTLIKHMQELGWVPYANDHEDANCQFEINWHFSDSLTTILLSVLPLSMSSTSYQSAPSTSVQLSHTLPRGSRNPLGGSSSVGTSGVVLFSMRKLHSSLQGPTLL